MKIVLKMIVLILLVQNTLASEDLIADLKGDSKSKIIERLYFQISRHEQMTKEQIINDVVKELKFKRADIREIYSSSAEEMESDLNQLTREEILMYERNAFRKISMCDNSVFMLTGKGVEGIIENPNPIHPFPFIEYFMLVGAVAVDATLLPITAIASVASCFQENNMNLNKK